MYLQWLDVPKTPPESWQSFSTHNQPTTCNYAQTEGSPDGGWLFAMFRGGRHVKIADSSMVELGCNGFWAGCQKVCKSANLANLVKSQFLWFDINGHSTLQACSMKSVPSSTQFDDSGNASFEWIDTRPVSSLFSTVESGWQKIQTLWNCQKVSSSLWWWPA